MTAVNRTTAEPKQTDFADPQTSDLVIMELGFALDMTHGLADALEASLVAAQRQASAELDPDLFNALPWPTTIDDYFSYLRSFAQWTPTPTALPAWQNSLDGSEEAQNRVGHFFLLIEQPAADGTVIRNHEAMAKWLTSFAQVSNLLA